MTDLQDYMANSIRNIVAKAYLNVLTNPRQAKVVHQLQQSLSTSEKRRRQVKESEGLDVPPFLISSISTTCNLHCKGCYARKNGIATDHSAPTMSAEQWRKIFEESASIGINFSIIAGGEPLMRRDVLEQIATVEDMVFPVFTNGTLINDSYLEFFKEHMNMIPVMSLEGNATITDDRRGEGVYRRVMETMRRLKEAKLFFGTSITVTTENWQKVTSEAFVDELRSLGCKIVFYVEYVPVDAGTEHLAFDDSNVDTLLSTYDRIREKYDDIIMLSFPGDEQVLGGCLAAGRGFFHIAPDGKAEPCPFSPFSDCKVTDLGVKEALRSPLFRKLKTAHIVGAPHKGGCTLFDYREQVEQIANDDNAI